MTDQETSLVLHEDAFYEYFKPYRHPETRYSCWGDIGLETFGEDIALVRSLDANYVWTVIDGWGSDQWIIPEIHYVNRICYLVTEIPHNGLPVEFRVHRNNSTLTNLGLKRQITKLKRAIEKKEAAQA